MKKKGNTGTLPLLLWVGAVYALPAQALKLETHVLLADDIVQDLKADGKLSVMLKRNGSWTTEVIAIPDNIKNAILAYPNEFRAGAAAADMMPDLRVAQMSVHPGHDYDPVEEEGNGGWTSDKWLAHALANAYYPNEIAYAYGMYVHGASDAISHTYVNQYAGGVFNFVEHQNDGYVPELRHMVLEKYIAKLAPKPIAGNPWSIVSLPDTAGYIAWHEGGTWRRIPCDPYPEQPLAVNSGSLETQAFDETSSGTDKTSSASAQSIAGDCTEYVANDPGFVAGPRADYMMRTFIYDPSFIRTKVTQNGANGPKAYPSHMVEYENSKAGGTHLCAIYDLRYSVEQALQSSELKALDEAINNHIVFFWTSTGIMPPGAERATILNWNNQVLQLTNTSLEAARDLNNRIHGFISSSTMAHHSVLKGIAQGADSAVGQIVDALEDLRDDRNELEEKLAKLRRLSCSWSDPVTCELIDELEEEVNDLRDRIEDELFRFSNRRSSLSSYLNQMASVTQSVIMVHRSLTNLPIDVATTLTANANPIRAMLMKWSQAIDTAMFAYSRAWFDSFKNSMDPSLSAYAPLEKWWKTDCHLQRLLGDSNELATTRCTLNQHLEAIADEISRSTTLLPSAPLSTLSGRMSGIGSMSVYTAKEQMRTWFTNYAMDQFSPDISRFVDIIENPVTDSSLNAQFRSATDSKFLDIPHMSSRVQAEMRKSTSGCNGVSVCFSKMSYPVYFSSTQLAKLSLLNSVQLATVETKAGMTNGSLSGRANILDKTLYSMDGNNAWLGSDAPPWLLKTVLPVWEERQYGPATGQLFGDVTNRIKFTTTFFKGPLAEGLFKPRSLVGVDWALPTNLTNSFKECYAAPFSSGELDNRCANETDVLAPPPDDDELGCTTSFCP